MRKRKIAAALLSAALLLGTMSGCGGGKSAGDTAAQTAAGETSAEASAGETQAASSGKTVTLAAAKSYDDVRAALREIESRQSVQNDAMKAMSVEDAAGDTAAAAETAAASAGDTAAPAASADYSGTNTQVQGVDEGDVVKTDGSYLYLLRNQEVDILKAGGPDTAEVGKFSFGDASADGLSAESALSMYVAGDTLILVTQENTWGPIYAQDETASADAAAIAAPSARTHVRLYALGDRTSPTLTADLVQDGYYQDSRLTGGVLYLVGNCDAGSSDSENPEDFVPCVGAKDAEKPLDAGQIYLNPSASGTTYAVVSAFDAASGKTLSSQAVLGGAGTVYMSAQNLYLASTDNTTDQSEARTEKQYQVTDCTERTSTILTRFALDGGKVSLAATGEVPGYPLNQFSLDEYDGHLRMAVTDDSHTYQIYTDPAYGFTNYKDGGSKTTSSVYVLDADLKTVGSLGPFADDERIYSVRFTGKTGYVVTFRETDPLFAVDLSDPAKPKLLSALKLTGFSNYLHPWGDGLMLGLGMEADAATGQTSGMKLSMFDVSDPTNVTEVASVKLDDGWSEALGNHKAVLADPDKGLVAFPGENAYLVYSYSKDGGFVKKGSFDTQSYTDGTRGLYIGDYFYVCSADGVTVASMDTLEKVWSQELAYG